VPEVEIAVEKRFVLMGHHPGIVEERVESAELLRGRGRGIPHLCLIAHVGGDCHGAASRSFDQPPRLFGCLGTDVDNRDRRSLAGEQQTARPSQSTTGAGYEDALSLEMLHCAASVSP
jgi:hypothetical protein